MKRITWMLAPLSLIVACGGGTETGPEPSMGPTEPPPAPPGEPATPAPAEDFAEEAEPAEPAQPEAIEATIAGKSGSKLEGTVRLEQTEDGVKVTVSVKNAPPGMHGTHVHEKADCSADDGKSAGGHFAPDGNPHGLPPAEKRHLGDLGNMEVGKDGTGSLEIVVAKANLQPDDPHSFAAKALIVHEKKDDGGQPAGNAGKRLGCAELVR